MRLIDADSLIEQLDKKADDLENEAILSKYFYELTNRASGIKDAIIEIIKAPTIKESKDDVITVGGELADFLEKKVVKKIVVYHKNKKKDVYKICNDTQWVPCSKRLPDKNGYYLVTRKNPKGHVTRVKFNPKQVEKGTYNSPWGNGDNDILAWMSLPEPYEENEG